MRPSGFVRACHPVPALAVTVVMTAYAFGLGWRGGWLSLLVVTLLVGQLSVGWSNDAFDARVDALAVRTAKPTVSGDVTSRALWIAACVALTVAVALSGLVAGWLGGSFHVLAVLMAWLYNTVLSRTVWSWLPYAVAFGAMPAFLSLGLDGSWPPAWAVAVFAIVGVSAHLANAIPDIDSDGSAGMDGLAIRIGAGRALLLCWTLLAAGTAILVAVTAGDRPLTAWLLAAMFVIAAIVGTVLRHRAAAFYALLAVVVVDVVALVLAGSLAG